MSLLGKQVALQRVPSSVCAIGTKARGACVRLVLPRKGAASSQVESPHLVAMAPSFYELLQAVSKLRFHPAPVAADASDAVTAPPCDSTTLLPLGARFARPPARAVAKSHAQRADRASLATLDSLSAGSEISRNDARLLREIGVLLRQRWERGYGEDAREQDGSTVSCDRCAADLPK